MIITKEQNGKIYLAKVNPPVDRFTPGLVQEWYFIGPGQSPFLTWISTTQYVVNFNYMSVNFTRLFDSTIWPPLQVDPVTSYNPVSLQRAEVWIPLTPESASIQWTHQSPVETSSLKRDDKYLHYILDTDTYWVNLTRVQAPQNVEKYRIYIRDIGTNPWVLLYDWSTDFQGKRIEFTGSFRKEFIITWGNGQLPGYQNFPNGTHPVEHLPSQVLTVDSLVESRYIEMELSISEPLTLDSPGNNIINLEPMPRFFFYSVNDSETVTRSSSAVHYLPLTASAFANISAPQEVVSLPSRFLSSSHSAIGF